MRVELQLFGKKSYLFCTGFLNMYKIKNGNLILTLCEYKFSRKELSRRDISHSYDVVLAAVMKNSV